MLDTLFTCKSHSGRQPHVEEAGEIGTGVRAEITVGWSRTFIMPANTLLCGERGKPEAITVADYQRWELRADAGWSEKPGFIGRRLRERYIDPVRALDNRPEDRAKKNGFYVMAVSCLLVETLEACWQGWETTEGYKDPITRRQVPGKSKEAFRKFFSRQPRFAVFAPVADEFYKRVRCGILHQGETTGGWIITRIQSDALFDDAKLKVNAVKFHNRLALAIDDYVRDLKNPAPGGNARARFDQKMKRVIENCG